MPTFSSTARASSFQSLGLTRGDHAGLQPLPVATGMGGARGVASKVRPLGADDSAAEDQEPAGPPPPSREELEAALTAQAKAEQELAAAQQELQALRARLEAEERSNRAIADSLDDALDGAVNQMRGSYADMVMAGCRRLLESMSDSEAVFHAQLDTVSEQLVLESDVVLRVSPAHKRAAESAIFGRMGWSVEVDTEMDDGCVAVCRNSLVDARLETALDGMEQALRAWLAQDGQGQQSK